MRPADTCQAEVCLRLIETELVHDRLELLLGAAAGKVVEGVGNAHFAGRLRQRRVITHRNVCEEPSRVGPCLLFAADIEDRVGPVANQDHGQAWGTADGGLNGSNLLRKPSSCQKPATRLGRTTHATGRSLTVVSSEIHSWAIRRPSRTFALPKSQDEWKARSNGRV